MLCWILSSCVIDVWGKGWIQFFSHLWVISCKFLGQSSNHWPSLKFCLCKGKIRWGRCFLTIPYLELCVNNNCYNFPPPGRRQPLLSIWFPDNHDGIFVSSLTFEIIVIGNITQTVKIRFSVKVTHRCKPGRAVVEELTIKGMLTLFLWGAEFLALDLIIDTLHYS